MSALPDEFSGPRTTPGERGSQRSRAGQSRSLSPLHQIAGSLGFAGVMLGVVILVIALAGFSGAFLFCPAVMALGVANLALTVIANRTYSTASDSAMLASLFLALLCIVGGMLEWML